MWLIMRNTEPVHTLLNNFLLFRSFWQPLFCVRVGLYFYSRIFCLFYLFRAEVLLVPPSGTGVQARTRRDDELIKYSRRRRQAPGPLKDQHLIQMTCVTCLLIRLLILRAPYDSNWTTPLMKDPRRETMRQTTTQRTVEELVGYRVDKN